MWRLPAKRAGAALSGIDSRIIIASQPHAVAARVPLLVFRRLVELASERIQAQIHCLLEGVGYF